MHLRAARPDEADRLTAIAHAAKRHWGYPEAWIERWRDQLTITPEYVAQYPTFVAELDGAVVAFVSIIPQARRAVLDHLWVLPEAMRRGLGRALFRHAEAAARRAGATTLTTTADPHAEDFYRKMGLVTVGHEDASLDGQTRRLPLMEKSLGA
jgi:GNAT superfamily N-acetyltransferase